jgi:hypothetical protein
MLSLNLLELKRKTRCLSIINNPIELITDGYIMDLGQFGVLISLLFSFMTKEAICQKRSTRVKKRALPKRLM